MDLTHHRLDVHDSQENDQQQTVRVQAAVRSSGGDDVVVSDWFDIEEPGDEESYDDALADACEDARGKLVSKLVDEFGYDRDSAWSAVDGKLIDGDMPNPR